MVRGHCGEKTVEGGIGSSSSGPLWVIGRALAFALSEMGSHGRALNKDRSALEEETGVGKGGSWEPNKWGWCKS